MIGAEDKASDEPSAPRNAAFELSIVLQNELNMTRWDPKNQLREIVLTKGPVLSLPYLSRIFPRLEW